MNFSVLASLIPCTILVADAEQLDWHSWNFQSAFLDVLLGFNCQGRSFQQQVLLHCNLLRAFYAPWIYGTRKSSLGVWAGDRFTRLQKGTLLFLAACVKTQMESEHVWLSHPGSEGNPGGGTGSRRAAFAHRARLSRWVHILHCLVVSQFHELAEAAVLTK